MTAVSVSALVKDYRSLFGTPHRALRGLTLSIPRGQSEEFNRRMLAKQKSEQ